MATMLPAKTPQKHNRKEVLWRNPTASKSRTVKLSPLPAVFENSCSLILSISSIRKRCESNPVQQPDLVDLPVSAQSGVWNKGFDLRHCVLGNDQHVAGTKGWVFVQIAPFFHFLDVEDFCRKPLVVDATEQQHLRMFRRLREAASNGDSFGQSYFAAHVIPSGMRHLAIGDEVWLGKVFQHYRDNGIVQSLAVGAVQGLGQLGNILTFDFDIAHAFQGHESIRLNNHGLVEFRAELE